MTQGPVKDGGVDVGRRTSSVPTVSVPAGGKMRVVGTVPVQAPVSVVNGPVKVVVGGVMVAGSMRSVPVSAGLVMPQGSLSPVLNGPSPSYQLGSAGTQMIFVPLTPSPRGGKTRVVGSEPGGPSLKRVVQGPSKTTDGWLLV